MHSPFRQHTIIIKWSNPIRWDRVAKFDSDWNGGWYYITRNIYRNGQCYVTPIYIGKASGKISKRILNHTYRDSEKPFLREYGEFEIRFGRVVSPLNYRTSYHYNRLLLTVESALITEIYPKCNCSQTQRYTPWYKLVIKNTGKHDRIPDTITTESQAAHHLYLPSWWDGTIV